MRRVSDKVVPVSRVHLDHNVSGRFESRFVHVTIAQSPAVMLRGLEGCTLGVWVQHAEGWWADAMMVMLTPSTVAVLITRSFPIEQNNIIGHVILRIELMFCLGLSMSHSNEYRFQGNSAFKIPLT